MEHYICVGGCGGVSEDQGNCEAEYCSKSGKPLIACNCDDGKHGKNNGGDDEDKEKE